MDKKDETRIQELLMELAECREDERNSQNLIVQVIVTAITVLGVLLGTSFFENPGKKSRGVFILLNAHAENFNFEELIQFGKNTELEEILNREFNLMSEA